MIDEIVKGDIVQAAVAFANRVVREGREVAQDQHAARQAGAAGGRRSSPRRARAWPRSIAATPRRWRSSIAWRRRSTLPFAKGVQRERELFERLRDTTESKALRHLFFAERQVTKIPDVPEDTPTREIKSAALIGAGTMGGGIAMNFANVGIPVKVLEMSQEALDKGLGIVRKNYAATVSKGRLTQEEMDKRMGLLQGRDSATTT